MGARGKCHWIVIRRERKVCGMQGVEGLTAGGWRLAAVMRKIPGPTYVHSMADSLDSRPVSSTG